MAEIIPAVIAKNFEDLGEKISNVSNLVPMVQVDVLNGSLNASRAWPYQSPTKSDEFFNAIIREEQGFPFWEDVEFEAHLMVDEPEKIIEDWIIAGASRIIIEIEGTKKFSECAKLINGRVPFGVSLTLDTPNNILVPIAEHCSIIQCMGWNFSHLGRQGEPLDEGVIFKIMELRKLYPEHIISVDGGVNLHNAPLLLTSGADRLVVGSALWNDGGVLENLEKFKEVKKF